MNNKIKYEIPVPGKVTIKIVDDIGMPAGVILNKHSEAGSYEVSLDEQMLMPGNYFYKIFFSDLNHSNTTLPNKNGSSKGTPYSSLIPGEAIATGEVKIPQTQKQVRTGFLRRSPSDKNNFVILSI